MKQALIDVYQKELNYLKRRGEAFAKEFPKIGARLHIADDHSRDPHVERIIQGVAFLNARIRKKLDDEFPELCQTLLDVIYPHYLRPLPSYNIIRFAPDKDLSTVANIPRGRFVSYDGRDVFACRFMTVYDTDILPFDVTHARLQTCPVEAPSPGSYENIKSVLRISLDAIHSAIELEKLEFNKVRFYIKGNSHYSFALYELLLNDCMKVAVAKGPHDPDARVFRAEDVIRPVGFDEDEGMLPYPEQSFIGYQLLTEYFAYPEKFLFFDVDLEALQGKMEGQRLELFFYFNKSLPDIEKTIDKDNFILNATPLINLYEQYSEPTLLGEASYEYPIIADARNPNSIEVYNIESVSVSTHETELESVSPFFGVSSLPHTELTDVRWHARREEIEYGNVRSLFQLSFINIEEMLAKEKGAVMLTRLRCFNGRIPYMLTQSQTHPPLILSNGSSAVKTIECMTPFTDAIRVRIDDDIYWQLLSHLNLNYVSLSADELGTNALRKILSLYNFTESGESDNTINALRIKEIVPATMRVVDQKGMPFFTRGSHVTLLLDESKFAGSSPYLFASVLERFLGLYTQVNSFVKLTVELQGKEQAMKTWPARSGEQTLL